LRGKAHGEKGTRRGYQDGAPQRPPATNALLIF